MMNAIDQLVHTTIRIETDGPLGAGSGTGFFMNLCLDEDTCAPVIVTNKHVVAGSEVGVLRFSLANAARDGPEIGHVAAISMNNFEGRWLKHPNADTDLAVLPFSGIAKDLEANGKPIFYRAFGMDAVADGDFLNVLTAIEDILMIGYPSGLWDAHHNFPIVRRGVTATPPSVPFNGRSEFVIDCACYPGSSGSPILLFNPTLHLAKDGTTVAQGRVRLLGVLWGGPQFDAVGEVHVVPVPTSAKEFALSKIPMNLGFCVRATELTWFEDHFQQLKAADMSRAAAASG